MEPLHETKTHKDFGDQEEQKLFVLNWVNVFGRLLIFLWLRTFLELTKGKFQPQNKWYHLPKKALNNLP